MIAATQLISIDHALAHSVPVIFGPPPWAILERTLYAAFASRYIPDGGARPAQSCDISKDKRKLSSPLTVWNIDSIACHMCKIEEPASGIVGALLVILRTRFSTGCFASRFVHVLNSDTTLSHIVFVISLGRFAICMIDIDMSTGHASNELSSEVSPFSISGGNLLLNVAESLALTPA